jgi:hypothetical protein
MLIWPISLKFYQYEQKHGLSIVMMFLINLDVIPNIQSEAGPVGNVLSYDLLDGRDDRVSIYYHPLIVVDNARLIQHTASIKRRECFLAKIGE